MSVEMTDGGTTSDSGLMQSPSPRMRARRTAVVVGAGAGLVVVAVLLGLWGYDAVATPAMPNVETAPVSELVAFTINERGLLRLAKFDQDRFIEAWRRRCATDAGHRELKQHLEACSELQRRALRQAMFQVRKRQFLADAEEYLRIRSDREKAYPFLKEKVAQIAAEAAWLKGDGDASKDLSGLLGGGLPRNPEDWTKLIVSETTPEERVVGEQYIDALKNVREQERKRGQLSASGPAGAR